MNNEPVAWMEIEYGGFTEYKVWREPVSSKSIPLYTHPVDAVNISEQYVDKTQNNRHDLTDEEILKMAADKFHYSEYKLVIEFARAILRKAQEK